MYDLADAAQDDALHVVDLPWRMTSPSARIPDRTRLWEDAGGGLAAWAVLQFPAWHCLDYVIRPDARTAEFESAVLAWACARLETEAADRGRRLPFFVNARGHDGARVAAIERAGFVREPWGYVRLVRDLTEPIPEPAPPPGFVVRSFAGEGEVDSYVAAHRAAIAPDGTLAGFCVCWITPPIAGRRAAQIEPLGILPAYQRQGLGRALLRESLRRAKERGAGRMEVNAESHNPASRGGYEDAGFRPAYEAPFFLRTFGERLPGLTPP